MSKKRIKTVSLFSIFLLLCVLILASTPIPTLDTKSSIDKMVDQLNEKDYNKLFMTLFVHAKRKMLNLHKEYDKLKKDYPILYAPLKKKPPKKEQAEEKEKKQTESKDLKNRKSKRLKALDSKKQKARRKRRLILKPTFEEIDKERQKKRKFLQSKAKKLAKRRKKILKIDDDGNVSPEIEITPVITLPEEPPTKKDPPKKAEKLLTFESLQDDLEEDLRKFSSIQKQKSGYLLYRINQLLMHLRKMQAQNEYTNIVQEYAKKVLHEHQKYDTSSSNLQAFSYAYTTISIPNLFQEIWQPSDIHYPTYGEKILAEKKPQTIPPTIISYAQKEHEKFIKALENDWNTKILDPTTKKKIDIETTIKNLESLLSNHPNNQKFKKTNSEIYRRILFLSIKEKIYQENKKLAEFQGTVLERW